MLIEHRNNRNKCIAVAALAAALALAAAPNAARATEVISDYGFGLWGQGLASPVALVNWSTVTKKFVTVKANTEYGQVTVSSGGCTNGAGAGVRWAASGRLDAYDSYIYSDAEDLHYLNFSADGVQLLQISPTITTLSSRVAARSTPLTASSTG